MSRFKKLDKRVKKLDFWDVGLTKWSVAAGILFIITVWPAAMQLVHSIHWGWFLAATILFALRPLKRFYS
jgi:hypothetical protein